MLLFGDPLLMLVMGVGLVLSLWAQARVKSTFKRYANVAVGSGLSGAEAAEAVCRASGVSGVRIERHQGFLSDHYDPRAKTLRLSPDVFDGRSISAIAVAAHEAGHSIQDARDYAWLGFRSKMVQLTNIGNRLWMLPFAFGAMLSTGVSRQTAEGLSRSWGMGDYLMALGILLFGAVVAFQVVTLPVEIDASRRAKAVLAQTGIVRTKEEAVGVEKVLDAAAWTYIAAALAGALQLAYMIMRLMSDRR